VVENQVHKMFIDGEWVDSSSGERIDVRDPSTGIVFEKVHSASIEDVRRAVDAAGNASLYRLAASVCTKDVTRAMRAMRDLQFGTVGVDEHVPVPWVMPWAGYGQERKEQL
jgi:acyl-CoA reductase-like NAD-dependent aldehyde dehydrogenase